MDNKAINLKDINIICENNKLIGISLKNQVNILHNDDKNENNNEEIFTKTKEWLENYFKGKNPNINEIDIKLIGTTFRKRVWEILLTIPYGKVVTYQDIALKLAKEMKINKMSAQAVGNAVGHNPISILVPCHRVVGKDGNLVGYDGGVDLKRYLLKLEGITFKDDMHVDIEKYKWDL